MIYKNDCFKSAEKYNYIWEKPQELKFLVDNMLYKLVKYLRNVGFDAAYIKNPDRNLLIDLSL